MQVTPIEVEHSAKDAYMFLVRAEGKNVLYTGDFRASEKVLPAVRELLGESEKLDLLITDDGLNPGALLPIHCEAGNREEFLSLHGNCLMLEDGQPWEVG